VKTIKTVKPSDPPASAEVVRLPRRLRRAQEREMGKRKPVDLDPGGAVMSVLNAALQSDAIRIALGSFLEGRDLKGDWTLEITGARLAPKQSV
jgi:hypothetical protein